MDFVVAHSTHAQTVRQHDSEATGCLNYLKAFFCCPPPEGGFTLNVRCRCCCCRCPGCDTQSNPPYPLFPFAP